jgi:hypothetical protein
MVSSSWTSDRGLSLAHLWCWVLDRLAARAIPRYHLFALDLRTKPFKVSMAHRDRELPVSEPIRYGAVSPLQWPLDLDFVPVFGVSDIGEPEVILLGPEEWDRVKPFAVAKNVACRRLSLTLGHNK